MCDVYFVVLCSLEKINIVLQDIYCKNQEKYLKPVFLTLEHVAKLALLEIALTEANEK
ncbi:MAG: hypothetical protein LBE70_02015 [Nitrososphaerota archaeon]|nr:hypothetical protein [Nitrososphaerota archaeon]